MEQKLLSELLKKARGLREPSMIVAAHRDAIRHNMLLIIGPYGKIIGMVRREDIFDAEGNSFDDENERRK